MKNALVISYYFPPAGGPGVQRVAKHVKYLSEWGYNPIVITADSEDYVRTSGLMMPLDESLMRDIPAGTEIHRVRSHQPFRVFELLRRLRLEYLREFFFIPDSAFTWIVPVILEARRIAREKNIDVIYTSVRPHSVAIAGWALKRLLARPWVLDFRDPWTQYFLATFPTRLHYRLERRLEVALLHSADQVIANTPTARENLLAMSTFLHPEKVSCIPNGYDAEDFSWEPSIPHANGTFSIVYAGAFCGNPETQVGTPNPIASAWRRIRNRLAYAPRRFDRSTHSPKFLLDGMSRLFRQCPDLRQSVRLIHIGPRCGAMAAYARRLGLEHVIEERGYIPHAQAVRCLEKSDAAFLCLAESETGERNDCVPQKIYEYLGSRKPVLALVPEGDARDILERAGTALMCPPRDIDAIKEALLALVTGNWRPTPDETFIQDFERRLLTARLAGIWDRMLAGPSAEPSQDESAKTRPVEHVGVVDITVIVPTRDRSEYLQRCLMALDRQDFPRSRFEVLVCDDGSREDLASVITRVRNRGLDVRLLREPPRGPAAARNLGIRSARGEIIAMTDSDTIPDSAWLRKLSETLQAEPEIVGVEGLVCAQREEENGPLVEGPTNLNGGVYLTCNCAYRKKTLTMIGGFDETFSLTAYEDAELAARALQVGRIAWQPEAIVMHPRRRLTLRTVVKKLRHWKFVFIMGRRYGYLGWKQYPATHLRLRVAALSTVALPLAKLETAAAWLLRRPGSAVKLALFGIVESLGALVLVVPSVIIWGRMEITRQNYMRPIRSYPVRLPVSRAEAKS